MHTESTYAHWWVWSTGLLVPGGYVLSTLLLCSLVGVVNPYYVAEYSFDEVWAFSRVQ
jgi:hypothetical protein